MNIDRNLLRLVAGSRLALIITIGFGFAAGVLTVLQAGLLSRTIDQVFLAGRSFEQVTGLLALLLVVIGSRALLAWGSEVSANAVAVRVKTSLRQRLFTHLLALGPAFTRQERTGELANTAVEGVEALDAYYSQYLPQLALAVLIPATFLFFVFPLDWLTGLVLLLTAPLIPIFMVLIGNSAQALTRRQWRNLSRMSAYFLDVLQGLATLKAFGRSQAQAGVIAQVSDRYRQTTMGVLRVTFLSALTLELVATLSTAVVAVEVALRLLYGRLSFEQALFLLLLAPEFYLPLRLLGTRFHAGMAGVEASKRIFQILETPIVNYQDTSNQRQGESDALKRASAKRELEATNLKSKIENLKSQPPAISFDGVHFAYPDRRAALQGVTFEIPAGKVTALIGPSGAGKSTLASLLLRFIEPQAGRIQVDGESLAGLSPAEWRTHLAWVPQNPYLFQDTVAANIRLARPETSLEQVVQAARQAHAHDFILALPQGYDTLIGERGAGLSGGQAQRIALARAFLKDASLVIFDEATADLDPASESVLQQAIDRLLEGRTALIIAHRLNTVLHADQIVLLDKGRVVESGTHQELSQQDGLYRRMLHTFFATRPMHASSPESSPSTLQLPLDSAPLHAARVEPSASAPTLPQENPVVQWGGSAPQTTDSVLGADAPPQPRTFLRLLRLVAPFGGLVALSALLGFAAILSGIGLMATSAYLISAAALHPSIASLQVAIVGVRFFGLSRGFFRYLERLVSHDVTFRVLGQLRLSFYQALQPLAPARLMAARSGDLLARIVGDIESLENFFVRVIAPPLVAVLVALAMGFFFTRFSLALCLALLAFMLLAGVGVPALIRHFSRRPGVHIVQGRAALSAALVDGIQGMPDLLACGQEPRQIELVQKLSADLTWAQRCMARLTGFQAGSELFLAQICMWVVLALAIPMVATGQVQGVYLAMLALAALTSFEAVAPLPLAAQYLESNLQSARRLFEVVGVPPEVRDPEQPLPLPPSFILKVENLRFHYPSPFSPYPSVQYALDGISFDLPPGKRLAFVGISGAGKSTLAHLLLRFWEFNEGEISLGGGDFRQFAQDAVRSQIAYVAQDIYLFNASLRDNLLLARPQASQAELERAAQQAHIHEFILTLPEGYDTWIGEQGFRLSEGERQRLAIARALLRDSPLLILDEPAANLDALTERQVLEALLTARQDRSTLLITHRLADLQDMDEILVLDRGWVVERGTHGELLARAGLYRSMWELQNQLLPKDIT